MGVDLAVSLVISYLLGAIPVGVLAGRLLGGKDPREGGSRNIGFTNVLRVAGKAAGIVTLVGDMGKGALAVLIVRVLLRDDIIEWELMAGAAVILGHMFPVFLSFKGGKGVATAMGVFLAIDWAVGVTLGLVWLVSAAIWRISSVAALIAFGSLPLWIWLFHPNVQMVLFAIGTTSLIVHRHRGDIARLLAGTESRLGQPRQLT